MICQEHKKVKAPMLCPVCLQNEVAQLQQELKCYGQHHANCGYLFDEECNCGYAAVIREIDR